MFDFLPIFLFGALGGGIVGWVIGHQMGDSSGDAEDAEAASRPTDEEHQQLETIARKIRALTISVAADVSAHQSKVAGITTELRDADADGQTESIVSAVAELVAANQAMQNRLSESQKQIREQTHQLQTTEQLANTDPLTGLANRRALDAKLASLADTPADAPAPVVALVDIDYFKPINDTYGHATGDEVLVRVAELLETRLGEHAMCARYGGEEYAVVSESAAWNQLAEMLDAVRQELGHLRLIPQDPTRATTFSGGVAERMPGESSEAWLERADRALYAAKRYGRNSVYACRGERLERFSAPAAPRARQSRESHARQTSIDHFQALSANIDLTQVKLAAAAIRLPDQALDDTQRQWLLERSRGSLRGIDRIDFEDPRTLIAMMVTVDTKQATAQASALLDLVNESLDELAAGEGTHASSPATMGIGLLEESGSAADVIQRATEQAGAAGIDQSTATEFATGNPLKGQALAPA